LRSDLQGVGWCPAQFRFLRGEQISGGGFVGVTLYVEPSSHW
jgi:hypothetical protein